MLQQKFNGLLILFLLFCMTNVSYAALSANTVNTIQGTPPYLKFDGVLATNLDALLRFDMPDGSGGTRTITPDTTTLTADKSWRFDQFTPLVTANNVSTNLSLIAGVAGITYGDDDGDTPHPVVSVGGTLTAMWSYQIPNGYGGYQTKTLSSADLSRTFDACNAPYTLTIIAKNVKAQSAYGVPIDNSYGNATQSYTINVSDYKFCYARPNGMNVAPAQTWLDGNGGGWNSGNPNRTGGYGGGYSTDFDPLRGFKASSATKFPTTSFVGAQFDLVMSNSQSAYTYSSSQPSAVSVSATGIVKFLSKPSGAVTITATPINPLYSAVTYTFNPTKVWALPQSGVATWAISQTKCGGASNVLMLSELTNSPKNAPIANTGWAYAVNAYTRAIDGGVFGEWGSIGNGNYPSSLWVTSHYWTRDIHTTGSRQFVVYSGSGIVGYAWTNINHPVDLSGSFYIACRG